MYVCVGGGGGCVLHLLLSACFEPYVQFRVCFTNSQLKLEFGISGVNCFSCELLLLLFFSLLFLGGL